MIVYSFLTLTLLLAFYSILILWRSASRAFRYSWHRQMLAAALALFVFHYGSWVYLSIYLRFVFAGVFLLVTGVCLFRKKIITNDQRKWKQPANIFLSAIFFSFIVLFYTGREINPPTIDLHFPFHHGKYLVIQGGKGLPANAFHVAARGATYAIDLVQLNEYGNRANHICSSDLYDYELFGDTVFSPCAGRVVRIENRNPDNIPPSRKRGPQNLNMVLIETKDHFVFMGHFKRNSVMVHEGDLVDIGTPLALAGNSGSSLEPHLHIQAHVKQYANLPWYQQPPALIKFDGTTYLMNEIITVPD